MVAEQMPAGATPDPLDGDPRLPALFGPAWPVMQAFHRLLAEEGPIRGLIGPREAARLWERHLLNSAVVAGHLGSARSLVDLGSGAGLPGVVAAAMAPEVRVTLLEPMARRVAWLEYVLERLELPNAVVVRGRAEDVAGTVRATAVTARAVAPLDKLYGWAAPLVERGGLLVALKGSRAADEVAASEAAARTSGWTDVRVISSSVLDGVEPTAVVIARREAGTRRVR